MSSLRIPHSLPLKTKDALPVRGQCRGGRAGSQGNPTLKLVLSGDSIMSSTGDRYRSDAQAPSVSLLALPLILLLCCKRSCAMDRPPQPPLPGPMNRGRSGLAGLCYWPLTFSTPGSRAGARIFDTIGETSFCRSTEGGGGGEREETIGKPAAGLPRWLPSSPNGSTSPARLFNAW